MISEAQYQKAKAKIDQEHSLDLSIQTDNGIEYPAELLYSNRMLSILDLVLPESNNVIKLAAQCQHLKRWQVPRDLYPYDRRGYHEWRRVVMDFQLEQTRIILSEAGIDDADITEITKILHEQGNKLNRDSQVIMDTACLVFLRWYMEPFASKHQNEKVADILKKTMRKMSSHGVKLIQKLELSSTSKQLIELVNS